VVQSCYTKISESELTEYELVYEIFESFEQMSQLQTKLLGATFEMLPGGPAQTHVGIGAVGHHPICLGEIRSIITI
jgi:hypothetical protein